MDELFPIPDGISVEDWAATSSSVHTFVVQSVARILALEACLNQTSQNSSQPLSSSPLDAPLRPAKKPCGGQPDHPSAIRERREPGHIIPLAPTMCLWGASPLASTLPDAVPPRITQQWELPPIMLIVTDDVQPTVSCPNCATHVTADPSPESHTGYGLRVTALVGYLHGTYHLRDRAMGHLLSDRDDLPVGLGSMVTCVQCVSQALALLDAAIYTAIQTTSVVNVDGTGWREVGQRRWLWTSVIALATSFCISASRGRHDLDMSLPATFVGIVGSDRWNAANRYAASQRCLCRSHLTRTIRALAEGRMRGSPWATDLLGHITAVFTAWHAFRDGQTTCAEVQQTTQPTQPDIRAALEDGQIRRWHKVTALSQELLTWRDALWTFVTHPGVEPTNNSAEQVLRSAMIWRKLCFGAQSADNSRFVEWILSVVTTCCQQGRNVWQLLTDDGSTSTDIAPSPPLERLLRFKCGVEDQPMRETRQCF